MKQKILDDLEPRLAAKKLKLVYAAESGSRAWGFSSPDSDYDIRFVFVKHRDAYLSLQDGLQDIQYVHDPLDFAGWDLRKALLLAGKSNPSLVEWLGSDMTYADNFDFRDNLKTIMEHHHSPKALAHHYINFMRNIRGKYLSDFVGEYTMKKYFYALRPILCVKWMQDHPLKLPPVRFSEMLEVDLPAGLLEEIQTLLKLKAEAVEKREYRSEVLDSFIKAWFETGHSIADQFQSRNLDMRILDDLYRETIEKAMSIAR
jgi:predicted nucleotidyltransferase